MKRLVYSPEISAWIKTDSGVFDLSSYITGFIINRKTESVSTAELTFRNPKVDESDGSSRFLFTQHKNGDQYGPMFHPMDPIIITLTRIKGYPVQVFTGYCDTSPYVQVFPGTAKLKASCTLKRLLYTYWDPGLPYVRDFLTTHGWYIQNGLTINPKAEQQVGNTGNTNDASTLTDGSIGYLLYSVLMDVGGWSHDDIFIQSLPNNGINAIVEGLYKELTGEAKASFQTMREFLKKTIGADNNLGGGGSGDASTSNASSGSTTGNPNAQAAAVGYPLSEKGSWGGGPADHGANAASHGVSSGWESVNAVDITTHKGTTTHAVDDGVIHLPGGNYDTAAENQSTSTQSTFLNGLKVHLVTNDNEWFYQHEYQLLVTDGQHVKKGDPIGFTGVANGSPHLHIACKNGDPSKLIKGIPGNPNGS